MGSGPRTALAVIVVAAALCWTASSQERRTAPESRDARAVAIDAALDWLKRHQNEDGSWGAAAFTARCDSDPRCAGAGKPAFDAGVTGLAALAFLNAGHDPGKAGKYVWQVRNGLKHLRSIQDAEGCFGARTDPRFTYAHAYATIAMCKAFGMSKDLPLRKSADQAVAFIYKAQNPYKGWRYGVQPGDNDASVTAWMMVALGTAMDGGVPVETARVMGGLDVLDSLTDRATGRTGYVKVGEPPVHPEGTDSPRPPGPTEPWTAGAICARLMCGAGATPLTKLGAELLAKKPPVWDESKGTIDVEYWYFGTVAMARLGGEPWSAWRAARDRAVIENQVKTGCARGSWDPKDDWAKELGRVYATAMMTLVLQAEPRSKPR